MSKTKSFWDKVCDFCCSNKEKSRTYNGRERDREAYTGREKDDNKDKLLAQDLDKYSKNPPGGPRIFDDAVEPLGDDSSSDEAD